MNMRLISKWLGAMAVMAAGVFSAQGEVLLGWDTLGYSSTPIPGTAPSVYNDSALTAATLNRGPGLVSVGGTNGFSANSWTLPVNTTIAEAIASNDYFTFTAIAQPGATFDVTNFAWNTFHSGTGPSNFVLRSSVDSFAADLALFVITNKDNNPLVVSTALSLTGQTNVEFRIYGYGASAVAGSARLANGADIGQTGLDMALFGTATGGFVPTNVQFTASTASAAESIGTYTVTVYKSLAEGNVSGNVSLSGTATEGGGADYTVDTTNFTMNGATTSATFVVTVNDDAVVESGETVVLTLANVAGGTVASPSVFTLTISDNDVAPEVPEGMAAFRFTAGPHLQVSTKDANITVSDVSLTAGGIETNVTTGAYFPNEPYVEETAGWTADSQGSAKAYQFTITPDVGYSVTITGISFRAYASGAGPSAVGYTVGGVASYATDAADSVLVVVSQAVTGVDNQTSPILVQIQGWTNGTRSTSGGGIMKLDDVVVFGTITSGSGYSQEQEDYIVGYWGSVGAYTGDDLDDDGDGFNNVEEFVARTIPVLPNGATSYFRNVSIAASTRTVGYPSVTGRQYRLWGSTNLIPGIDWTQVAGPQVGDGLSQSLQEGVATTSSVFRLTVELTNP